MARFVKVLNTRAVRIGIGIGSTLVVSFFLLSGLNHRCSAGYKWFEHYGPIVVGVISATCFVFVRRLWLAAIVATAIPVAFYEFVIPPYLAWIHGPNHPDFPAAEAGGQRVLDDLHPIDVPPN
jgi:hypothetical protein